MRSMEKIIKRFQVLFPCSILGAIEINIEKVKYGTLPIEI